MTSAWQTLAAPCGLGRHAVAALICGAPFRPGSSRARRHTGARVALVVGKPRRMIHARTLPERGPFFTAKLSSRTRKVSQLVLTEGVEKRKRDAGQNGSPQRHIRRPKIVDSFSIAVFHSFRAFRDYRDPTLWLKKNAPRGRKGTLAL